MEKQNDNESNEENGYTAGEYYFGSITIIDKYHNHC
jgi:hypothetical protein